MERGSGSEVAKNVDLEETRRCIFFSKRKRILKSWPEFLFQGEIESQIFLWDVATPSFPSRDEFHKERFVEG